MVLNSGFTFREYDYLNNARQIPKLPDWAIVDITVAAERALPGQDRVGGILRREVGTEGSPHFSESGLAASGCGRPCCE